MMSSPLPLESELITAVRDRAGAEVMALLHQGANPNVWEPESGLSPLMLAAGMGAEDIIAGLLGAGAWINVLDRRAGATAIHKACQGGHLSIVQALVAAGAWIDLQTTTTGHTPLVEAIWFKADELVAYLLAQGARTELKTYYGFSLDDHIAYAQNVNKGEEGLRRLQRIKELVAQKRAQDMRAGVDQTLNKVLLQTHEDVEGLEQAIRMGGDLEERCPLVGTLWDGHTPLLLAALKGYTASVQALIQAGADVNAIDPIFGAVPLHKATYNGYAEITRLLTQAAGVHLDYQGPSNGYTPLHDALWHGYPQCAHYLLDAGARIDIRAYDGKFPIDIAREELPTGDTILSRLRSPVETTL